MDSQTPGGAGGQHPEGREVGSRGRPHSSLGHLTPNEFVGQRQVSLAAEKSSILVKNRLGMGPTSTVGNSHLILSP